MGFWNLRELKLDEFRPGIWSKIESGKSLTMAFMEISPDKEGPPHSHPFDQCGIVVEGGMELSLGEEKRLLGPMETYFIPAGRLHRWRTFSSPAKIVDVVPRQD